LPQVEKFQKRQTAYKIRANAILDSKYIKTEGFEPNYLEVDGQEISRINIIGVIVEKSSQYSQGILAIDDGTGKISARVFENNVSLNNLAIGDIVLIIGRPREFSSEKYILIETIKKIDSGWAKVRKLELKESIVNSKPPPNDDIIASNNEDSAEEVVATNSTNEIVKLIKELDKGNGVSVEDIPSKNIKDIDKIIDMLLKEGDIFEIKPGRLKVLE
jgi:RPA family protein|tara:strand:- start:181 stop:831 length:651 start_codon:yes stop_codon:yes gene_type:complete